jgi:hypothetical protein
VEQTNLLFSSLLHHCRCQIEWRGEEEKKEEEEEAGSSLSKSSGNDEERERDRRFSCGGVLFLFGCRLIRWIHPRPCLWDLLSSVVVRQSSIHLVFHLSE